MLQRPYFINLICVTTPGNFSCKDDTYILMTNVTPLYSQCPTLCEFTSMRLVQVNIMIMSQVYRPNQEWHAIARTHLGTSLNSAWCAISHIPTLDTYSVMFEGYF